MKIGDERRRKKRLLITVMVFAIVFLVPATISAWSGDFNWYVRNKDILSQNNFIKGAVRWLGWAFIKGLVLLCNGTQKLYDTAFTFIDVTDSEMVVEYMNRFKPVVIALMALSLLYLGYILMVEHEKKPKIMTNICIVILCVTSSSLIFETLNDWTIKFKDEINGNTSEAVAYEVVNKNMTDLVFLHDIYSVGGGRGLLDLDWSNTSSRRMGSDLVNENDFWMIDFTEVLNWKSDKYDWSNEEEQYLKHYYFKQKNRDGIVQHKLKEVNDGWGKNKKDDDDFGNTFYYRYTFKFLEGILQLGALIIIYLTMSYKVIRCVFELVVARLFAYLYSAELSGGEKIKKILVFIRDTYILLVVTALCIKVYLLMENALDRYALEKNWNSLIVAFFLLFLAFAVIDGPNLVEKLLGMDAGLKSSTARMLAIGRAASGVGRMAKGAALGAAAGIAAAPKNIAQKANVIKSGRMSEGGLAGGAVGAIFGKESSSQHASPDGAGGFNISNQTTRQGGLAARLKENKSAGQSGGNNGNNQGSQAAQKGEKGSSGLQGSGSKGDRGERGQAGLRGLEGKEGKAGEQGKDGKDKSFMEGSKSSSSSAYSSSSNKDWMNGR